MRHFSFKILLCCILLPPILYILTIQTVERYINDKYAVELENIYLGDTAQLLNGSKRLNVAINDNINRYLQEQVLSRHGIKVDVTVSTKKGRLLYPGFFEDDRDPYTPVDSTVIASENYQLMNEGLVLKLEASVQHNKLFSNGLLAALIIIAMLVLYFHYRRVTDKIQQEEQQKIREMSRLRELEDQSTRRLRGLSAEHEELTSELNRLKALLEDQKTAASRNEDELFDEIESLEDKLNANLALQASQQQEIDRLTEQLRNQESEKQIDVKKKMKASQAVGKRFSAIYKNIVIGSRALDGFVELNEDLKIKAEELIHQLNQDSGQVVIKRKVFIGKRDKKNIKEVIFGYKGRLYFRNLKDGGIEVLAIGTKNTQAREMEYLNKL